MFVAERRGLDFGKELARIQSLNEVGRLLVWPPVTDGFVVHFFEFFGVRAVCEP